MRISGLIVVPYGECAAVDSTASRVRSRKDGTRRRLMTLGAMATNMLDDGSLPTHCGALHVMGMPSLKRDWTVADLADFPDDGNRYEVLDGMLYVTPAPSFDHQTAL